MYFLRFYFSNIFYCYIETLYLKTFVKRDPFICYLLASYAPNVKLCIDILKVVLA